MGLERIVGKHGDELPVSLSLSGEGDSEPADLGPVTSAASLPLDMFFAADDGNDEPHEPGDDSEPPPGG